MSPQPVIAAVAVGNVVALALILGGMDRRDAEITAKHEKAAAQKKADVKPADRVFAAHRLTIPCTWISKTKLYSEPPKPLCVAADLSKEAAR